jgi:hypothetical protein
MMALDGEIVDRLKKRRDAIRRHLEDDAPFTFHDQKHQRASTPEWAYWHHGYQAALDDVIALVERSTSASRNEDKSG